MTQFVWVSRIETENGFLFFLLFFLGNTRETGQRITLIEGERKMETETET